MATDAEASGDFTVWVASCSHVGTDLRHGRRSLACAIQQSEGDDPDAPAFPWDIMLDLGDLSGAVAGPDAEEGQEVRDQYAEARHHRREQVYNIAGNHDASLPEEETQWWFRRYGDPTGQFTAYSGVDPTRRPFPVDGTWERYSIRVGNILFLMMSDRNDGGPPVGRGARGGYPAGAVTGDTFDWWVSLVEANPDLIIVTAHHHMLKETTVGSGPWEGFRQRDRYGAYRSHYHGYFRDGGPMGAGYLYWVDGNPDAGAFERYLQEHPGAIDLWLGGHTHTNPDDVVNGRSHIERRWGVTFANCAALTRHHAPTTTLPMSRVVTFRGGRRSALVACYLHSDDHAPCGWYPPAERTVPLRHAFQSG